MSSGLSRLGYTIEGAGMGHIVDGSNLRGYDSSRTRKVYEKDWAWICCLEQRNERYIHTAQS